MTEEGLNARLLDFNWDDIERRLVFVSQMTLDELNYKNSRFTESPQVQTDEEEKF
jgi:hypothetical protein